MQKQINALMQKQMSRKEFLAVLGFGAASVFGLSAILGMLGHSSPLKGMGSGYGTSTYGN